MASRWQYMACASVYAYVPKRNQWANSANRAERNIIYAIKNCVPYVVDGEAYDPMSMVIDYMDDQSRVPAAFRDEPVLVPLPRSTATHEHTPAEWPALQIAAALALEFDLECEPAIQRRDSIVPNHLRKSGEYPSIREHQESLEFAGDTIMLAGRPIILVDDVLTSGTTMAAAANLVRIMLDELPVAAFAVGFTSSDEVDAQREFVTHEIRWMKPQYRARRNDVDGGAWTRTDALEF